MLFFLASGFVIPISLERSSLRHFWLRRFFRLYPMYWSTLALAVLLFLAGLYSPPNDQFALIPVWSIIANATMLQTFLSIFHIIPAFWSLLPELLFYALVSLLVALKLFPRSLPIAVTLIVSAIIAEGILPRFGWIHIPLLEYIALMATSTVLYRASTQSVSWRYTIAVSGLCVLMFALIPAPLSILSARLTAVPCFALILYWRPKPRLFVYLGTISYSLYLIHSLVIAVLHTGNSTRDFFLWMACSMLIAGATYRWIERPAIWSGQLIGNSRRIASAAPIERLMAQSSTPPPQAPPAE